MVSSSKIPIMMSSRRTSPSFIATDNTIAGDKHRQYFQNHSSRRHYSSLSSVAATASPATHVLSLVENIRDAYQKKETDGILALVQRDPTVLLETPAHELIQSSIEAAQNISNNNNNNSGLKSSRAAAASIINAWIGACSLSLVEQEQKDNNSNNEDLLVAANVTKSLWVGLLEEQEDNNAKIFPDIVTFCLAYHAILPVDPLYAQSILERGLQVSKKQAGSKRRKALAAVRRRGNSDTTMDTQQLEESLRDVLEDDSIRILMDTDEYIILSKPSGVTCYHTMTTTKGKIPNKKRKNNGDDNSKTRDISMEDALLHCQVPLSTLNADCQGLVHRLDRGTSGCMIWSKTNEMHAKLVTAFFLRQVKKQYTALVTPAPTHSEWSESEYASVLVENDVHGHAARSRVNMLESFGTMAALVQVEPSTGRRHQVRVHCAEGLDSPVLLDPLYSKKHDNEAFISFIPQDLLESQVAPNSASTNSQKSSSKKSRRKQNYPMPSAPQDQRFFLHASSLVIPTLDIDVQAPLPVWWEGTLENLRGL